MSILSPELILWATETFLYLLDISKFEMTAKSNVPTVTPIWSYGWSLEHEPGRILNISPIIWNRPGGHHVGVVSILSRNSLFVLKPSYHVKKCDIWVYRIANTKQSTIGSLRAIIASSDVVSHGNHFTSLPLQFVHFLQPSKRGIKSDGSQADEPRFDPIHRHVHLPMDPKDIGAGVVDISWDEESGRICTLTRRAFSDMVLTMRRAPGRRPFRMPSWWITYIATLYRL